jgi:ABC-type dipeptide/oligopeptide/nickel transport system ATPase component
MSDHLMVMKQGALIEQGEADSVFTNPKDTYTQQLLAAIPSL